jgi:hypothetical protein
MRRLIALCSFVAVAGITTTTVAYERAPRLSVSTSYDQLPDDGFGY